MKTATATYVAPFGDNKVVEMGGVTFFDGKAVQLNSYEHGHLIGKLEGNQYFDVTVSKDDDKPIPLAAKKRGRPSAADVAAAKAEADKADSDAKAAAEKAKGKRADSEAAVKARSVKEPDAPAAPVAKVDVKAGMAQATAHDFEKDRQDEIARRDAQAQASAPRDETTS